VLLDVRAPFDLTSAEAVLQGKTFPMFPHAGDPQRWFGLLGVDLEAKTGPVEVTVKATGTRGEITGKHALRIMPKEFPVRRLQVDESFVTPPAEVQARIERESRLVAGLFKQPPTPRRWEGTFERPVPGAVISSFGRRSVFNNKPRSPHSGADFRAATGTPIKAPNHGRVILVRDLYFAGQSVIIDHGLGLYTYFAHLSAFDVTEGQDVKKGQLVGKVGATGRVTGPHLHWTARLGETRIDPLSLMEVLEHLESRP
jgi:murein DD-endopeptidase MepM/ murein hydrolase activator NlpD